MKKYKVSFVTGSRADYGIVRNYISKLNNDPDIDFSILTTGALFSDKFGKAIDLIEKDGFKIDFKNIINLKMSQISDTVKVMSEILNDFNNFFNYNAYDLLIILGDRYEIFSVAIAAAMHRIPILHLHGGEITLANYDEFIRHSITKMAQYHITSTEEYRKRVIQLGEIPENVYNLGALGAENCHHIDMKNVSDELKEITDVFTVLFHPETLNTQSPVEQINELLKAITLFLKDYRFIFIGSNADTLSDQISTRIIDFCALNQSCIYFNNLHPDSYHWLIKNSIALIGNSSSGIIEAPSLGTFTINVGDRQTGRSKGKSVLDVKCSHKEIGEAISFTISNRESRIVDDVYFRPHAAELYYRTTKEILNKVHQYGFKAFYDI